MSSLFFAIDPSEQVQSRFNEFVKVFRNKYPTADWTPPGKWHITLAFWGDAGDLPIMKEAAYQLQHLPLMNRFDLTCTGLGTFGSRVLFSKVEQAGPASELDALHMMLARSHRAMGGFHPHITIAKNQSRQFTSDFRPLAREHEHFQAGEFTVNAIKLYRTHGSGKPYECVASKDLL